MSVAVRDIIKRVFQTITLECNFCYSQMKIQSDLSSLSPKPVYEDTRCTMGFAWDRPAEVISLTTASAFGLMSFSCLILSILVRMMEKSC